MTVVAFPERPALAPPSLDLLSYVFAAMSVVGEPASARDLAEVIAESLERQDAAEIERQVFAILDYYVRRALDVPIAGHVFRQFGDQYAYTVEFRTHLARHGFEMSLRPVPAVAHAAAAGAGTVNSEVAAAAPVNGTPNGQVQPG